MTIDHDRFAEANQPPPERVAETPGVEGTSEPRPAPNVEPESDDRGADPFGPDYGCDLRGLIGKPDLARVEASVSAALSEALAPYGFTVEWRADRSKSLDEGTLFGVMYLQPRRPK